MATIDEIRAVFAEELELQLAPLKAAIAKLGDPHSAEQQEAAAYHAGVLRSRQALLRRQQRIREAHGAPRDTREEDQEESAAPSAPQAEPEAPPDPPPRRPVRRFRVRECSRCMGQLVRDEVGLRCPKSGCEDVVP